MNGEHVLFYDAHVKLAPEPKTFVWLHLKCTIVDTSLNFAFNVHCQVFRHPFYLCNHKNQYTIFNIVHENNAV